MIEGKKPIVCKTKRVYLEGGTHSSGAHFKITEIPLRSKNSLIKSNNQRKTWNVTYFYILSFYDVWITCV